MRVSCWGSAALFGASSLSETLAVGWSSLARTDDGIFLVVIVVVMSHYQCNCFGIGLRKMFQMGLV